MDMRRGLEDRGVSLVETMMAVIIAFIAMSAIGGVVFSSLVANKNQGTEVSRMTVIAQEKMNELLGLSYSDTTTNTTLVSDTGWAVGLSAGGGTAYLTACPSGAPDQGYVDFLDNNGKPLNGTCSTVITSKYGYERRWQISAVSGVTGLKQITVVVYALNAVATNPTPSHQYVTLTTMKSQ
jgi:hypothetical protein